MTETTIRYPGPIQSYLAGDHQRLEALLDQATSPADGIDLVAFGSFRVGLLRHIGMEEKIVAPAARRAAGGGPLPHARRLRVEHGAIVLLLVPTPDPTLAGEIRSLLDRHNRLEEEPAGFYETCDRLLAGEAKGILSRLQAFPDVKTVPYYDGPRACRTAAEALEISGRQGRSSRPDRGTGPGESEPAG